MKANELKCTDLRIGNYLKYDDEIIQVSKLCKNYVEFYDKEDILVGDNPEYFEPIELTGDILINIGFKKGYNEIYSKTIKYDFYEYSISYQNVKDNKYSFVAYGYKNGELKRQIRLDNIQYLHELQNVFFSFTNQELNIEL